MGGRVRGGGGVWSYGGGEQGAMEGGGGGGWFKMLPAALVVVAFPHCRNPGFGAGVRQVKKSSRNQHHEGSILY